MTQGQPKTSKELTAKEQEFADLTAPLLAFDCKGDRAIAPDRTLAQGWADL